MQTFPDTFETSKQSFISAFSIGMIAPLQQTFRSKYTETNGSQQEQDCSFS